MFNLFHQNLQYFTPCPGQVANLVGELTCIPEGCRFNSTLGDIPRLQVLSMVGHMREVTDRWFSLSLFLSPSLSKIILVRIKKKFCLTFYFIVIIFFIHLLVCFSDSNRTVCKNFGSLETALYLELCLTSGRHSNIS